MAPTFSIVIPTYNRAHIVGRAIRSCLAQTFDDFEIVISDDVRSTDRLADVLAAFEDSRIRLLHHRGTGAAGRNIGIEAARGQYIAFLDSDDAFLPRKLEICLKHLGRADGCVYYSQVYADRGVGKLWLKPRRGLGRNETVIDYLLADRGWITTSTMVMCTSIAKEVRFNEMLTFAQDTQFAIDAWKKNYQFEMIQEPLVLYDNSRRPDRVSQNAFFASSKDAVDAYLAWLALQEGLMPEKAYYSCCARVVSRLVAKEHPLEALYQIRRAYTTGALGLGEMLSQGLQTFAPTFYWSICNAVARFWGVRPSSEVGALLHNGRLRKVRSGSTTCR